MKGRQPLRAWMLIALGVSLLVAWLTPGFLHPDEHYQILELSSYLLGRTPASDLAWEFRAQIRPFLQPLLYFGVGWLYERLGHFDPHSYARLLRLLSAVVGVGAAWHLARVYPRWLRTPAGLRLAWAATALAYFLPFLRSRPSSESWAGAAMLSMVALLAPAVSGENGAPKAELPARTVILAFALGGLSFLFRYQMALMLVGVGLWCVLIARFRFQQVLLGAAAFASVVLLGVLADRLGYGEWVLAPVRYFSVNLLEGRAADFGTRPTDAYLGLLWHDLGKPFGALVVLAFLGVLLTAPKHLLVWTVVPFVLVHAAIAHKETRFLFPCLFFAPIAFAMVVERLVERWPGRGWRVLAGLLLLLNFYYLATAQGFFLTGGALREALDDAIAERGPAPIYYSGAHPYDSLQPRMSLYWGREVETTSVSVSALEARVGTSSAAFYYSYEGRHRPQPELPQLEQACTELYRDPWLLPRSVLGDRILMRALDVRHYRALYFCDWPRDLKLR